MSVAHPLDWIRQIDDALIELDEKPQFGPPLSLDWKELESGLQRLFDRPELTLSHEVRGWMASQQILTGLGGSQVPLSIDWTPLQSPSFFITDQYNLKELMAYLFTSEDAAHFFYETALVQGFYTYFASEILSLLDQQKFASPLTPRLGSHPEEILEVLGEESCFVIDLSLNVRGKNFWGRILLSESFRQEWKTYFAHKALPPISQEMREKIVVELGLEVANSQLGLKDWRKIKRGDFILLDHCSYDPDEHTGSLVLTLQRKPLFRGRLKEGHLKITNYPVYEEASETMKEGPFGNSESDDEDDDIYEDLGEDEDLELDEDDDDIFGLQKEAPVKSSSRREEKEELHKSEEMNEEGPSISLQELPLHLTVEVGKIRMSVGELMNLAPGNLLELNVKPEQGVDLIVNGKKVGRGELIRMGDVLGVRILDLLT